MLISVIIPCRNEVEHIESCLHSILEQDLTSLELEIIVADGMSDDGTREILWKIAKFHLSIKIIDNPQKIVSCGLNLGVGAARGDIVIRMDAHTEYARDYILNCVRVLHESGADNVGGPWRARGNGYFSKAVALAFQSSFGGGGALSHKVDYEGYVDSVYLGCWPRLSLIAFGLFDEGLVRNQDDELNLRIVRSGGKIWQSPKIKSWYCPRGSLKALFKQYMQYGYWKVKVIQKHKLPASIRHLVPGCFVGALAVLLVAAPFSPFAAVLCVIFAGLYVIMALAISAVTCQKPESWKYFPIMPLVYGACHFGYGYGFLRGGIDFVVLRRSGRRKTFSEITRGSQ